MNDSVIEMLGEGITFVARKWQNRRRSKDVESGGGGSCPSCQIFGDECPQPLPTVHPT